MGYNRTDRNTPIKGVHVGEITLAIGLQEVIPLIPELFVTKFVTGSGPSIRSCLTSFLGVKKEGVLEVLALLRVQEHGDLFGGVWLWEEHGHGRECPDQVLDDEAVWPWVSGVLNIVVVVSSQLKPVENLGEKEDPVSRTHVDGFEHGGDLVLDILKVLVGSLFEVASVKSLLEF